MALPSQLKNFFLQKSLAYLACLLILVGIIITDLYCIFDRDKLEKRTQKSIGELFQAPVKMGRLHFNFSSRLLIDTISIKKAEKFEIQIYHLVIQHNPWLVLFGIFYPQKTQIGNLSLKVMAPQWKPPLFLEIAQRTKPYIDKLHHLQVRNLTLSIEKNYLFPHSHIYFLDDVRFREIPQGFAIEASQSQITPGRAANSDLPWTNLQIFFSYQREGNLLRLFVTAENFHLHEKSWKYFPRSLHELFRQKKMEGILDIQLNYSFSPKEGERLLGEIKGYNMSWEFSKRELTKGEIFINLNNRSLVIEKLTGLWSQSEVALQGRITFGSDEAKFRGSLDIPSLRGHRSLQFQARNLNELCSKIFQDQNFNKN